MKIPEGIRCPAYRSGETPACGQTFMSGEAMQSACPEGVKQATDEACFVIPQKVDLIPKGFLTHWKQILEKRAENDLRRLG